MEISYQLTEDDYGQGFKAFRRRKPLTLWLRRIGYICFFSLLSVIAFLAVFGQNWNFSDLSPPLVLLPLWGWCLWYGPRRVARKMIRESPSARLPQTMISSEEGLYFRNQGGESRLTWSLFTGWGEAERVFALFPSPLSFLPIPKRAMTDTEQNEFRTLLAARITGQT